MLSVLLSALFWIVLGIGAVGYVLTGFLLASAAMWLANVNDRFKPYSRGPIAIVGGCVWPLAIMGICLAVTLAVVRAAICEYVLGRKKRSR